MMTMTSMRENDLNLKDYGGSFNLLVEAAIKVSNGDENGIDLKLKDDDVDGSFDLLVKAAEKASNGDEDLKLQFLTARVIEDLVNSKYEKAMEKALLVVREEEEAFQKDIDGPKFDNLCFDIPKKPRSNKRRFFSPHTEEDDDYENEEIVRKPPLKKQRKTYNLERKKKNYDDEVGTDPPVELRSHIERMKGSDVVLVMQKKLTTTDMDTHQNRLSVPRGKIRKEFLTEEEKYKLEEKGGIKVSMVEPCLEETSNLELKKWKMGGTFSYALIGKWSAISTNQWNQLQPNSLVQLWSFRVGSHLWFALVKV
ncbi:hypothetical protein ACOSQ3_014667 [Xanthoceras sorbifolium]